jgi:spore coat protein X
MDEKCCNWRALDKEEHPMKMRCKGKTSDSDSAVFNQDGAQVAKTDQSIKEVIYIKDSCNVKVRSEQEQFAATINIGVNLIISLLNIILDDGVELVTQELLQVAKTTQSSKQKVVIVNCKDIDISLEDENTAVTLNLFLNIFVAILNVVLDLDDIL